MNLKCLFGRHELVFLGTGVHNLWTSWECTKCGHYVSRKTVFGKFIHKM